mmetsp:Transcript_11427/g.29488  ORF Transcript_11427/g.29488 Transcript_11427/m.29488 type:complete len:435 (-) Transcript_11427:290-1594(-)
MKLLPLGAEQGSDWEDGLWADRPGYPPYDGSWLHPPPTGAAVPEFECQEGHDLTKNEPAPAFSVGTGNDCHIRLPGDELPPRICRVYKEGRTWLLEALLPDGHVHHGSRPLRSGDRVALVDGDCLSIAQPPTALGWRIRILEEDNWYLDQKTERDYPNKYPSRFPARTSLRAAPPAPEELRRLAWQTDQMRRRSEEDQVRVADWSAFSQYVKRHYYQHGIECTPWCETGRGTPIDKKPPSYQPRAYPAWISDLLKSEQQLPGVDPTRRLSFESCLSASGLPPCGQRSFRGAPPWLEDLYAEPPSSGLASLSPVPGVGRPTVMPGGGGSAASSPARPQAALQPVQPQSMFAPSRPPAHANPYLRVSFRDWLESMDESGFLVQYHDQIAANFDSLEQIHEIYFKGGEIGKAFFEDAGIRKLGHRRIFEKWFRDHSR